MATTTLRERTLETPSTSRRERIGELGRYHVERASPTRRLAMHGYRAVPPGHKVLALLELDVTDALAAIALARAEGKRVSLFGFVVHHIANALAENPTLNVVHERNRFVRFDDVDVNVPVELDTSEGLIPRQLVVRRANEKSAFEIYDEIEAAKRRFHDEGDLSPEDRFTGRVLGLLTRVLPGVVMTFILARFVNSPWSVKRFAGTTIVTSVSKFASIPGFVVPLTASPMAAMFALGSVVTKPAVKGDAIVPRSFLSLTIVLDHDVVDGGPAARFAKRLQERIESVDGLR